MNKRYAFTDIHGNYKLLKKVLEYCDKNDEIYFLGDAADRGLQGLECIELLLNDIRVKYLIGNHEKMFLDSYIEFKRQEEGIEEIDFYNSSLLLWISNSGDKTWYPFLEKYNQEQRKIFLEKIKSLPKTINFTNKNGKLLLLSHSGCSYPSNLSMEDVIWNREHLSQKYWEDKDNIYIVHGHTPTVSHYFNKSISKPEIVQYCDNHKIDIDMGTYVTNCIALLDLDSIGDKELSVVYFYD